MKKQQLTNKNKSKNKGFTLVELMVSVSIFAFMTAFLLAKYGNFNRSVFLTNLAYDIALTVRSAQSYGLQVKGVDDGSGVVSNFQAAYGVNFSSDTQFTLFADTSAPDFVFTADDQVVNNYTINRKNKIGSIDDCAGSTLTDVSVLFKRPNPDAIITASGNSSIRLACVDIHIEAPDGTQNTVEVRNTGQIAVKNQ